MLTPRRAGPQPNLGLHPYFADYAGHHRTLGNQACHSIGIPLIMLGLLGLLSRVVLSRIPVGDLLQLDLAVLLWLGSMLWYLSKSFRLGAPFAIVTLGFYFAGRALPVPFLWVIFVLGWVFQGIGHAVYEKRGPAFMDNALHILVGPIWIFAKLVRSA